MKDSTYTTMALSPPTVPVVSLQSVRMSLWNTGGSRDKKKKGIDVKKVGGFQREF